MTQREKRASRGFWAVAAATLVGAVTLVMRSSPLAPVRAMLRARYDGQSARGRASTPASADAQAAGHETSDMRGGLMAKLFLLLGAVACCMVFAMIGLRIWVSQVQRDALPAFTLQQIAVIVPPKPNLQADPVAALAELRARSAERLSSYGYRGEDHTRAHIPIDRAMALTVGQELAPPP